MHTYTCTGRSSKTSAGDLLKRILPSRRQTGERGREGESGDNEYAIQASLLNQSTPSDWLIQRLFFAHGCMLLTCMLRFTKANILKDIVSNVMADVPSARNAELSSQLSEDETESPSFET